MRGLLALALLSLGACQLEDRRRLAVHNPSSRTLSLTLEERHPTLPTMGSEPAALGPGQSLRLWWDPAFETTLQVHHAGQLIWRQRLAAQTELTIPTD